MRSRTRGPVLTPGILLTLELGLEQCTGAGRGHKQVQKAIPGNRAWDRPATARSAELRRGQGCCVQSPSDTDSQTRLHSAQGLCVCQQEQTWSSHPHQEKSLLLQGRSHASRGQFPGSRKKADGPVLQSRKWNPPRFPELRSHLAADREATQARSRPAL